MRVLIIPEDFRNDQHILKPLFLRLFQTLLSRRVNVDVCKDPLLGGVGEALKVERMQEIVDQYGGMTDIFILCVDRDGETGRRTQLDRIESSLGANFFAENAWEEVETWVLAGIDLPSDWRWRTVRAEISVKEVYFEELARMRGVEDEPGGGRKALAEEAARNLRAIRQKCREDFDALALRLESHVSA